MKKILGLCDKNSRRAISVFCAKMAKKRLKPVGIFEQKTHPRWVKFFTHILMVILAVAVYLPCRELAIMERGTSEGIGGEALMPVLVFLTYIVVMDYWKEKKAE